MATRTDSALSNLPERHRNLRDVITWCEAAGELLRIENADPDLELGVLTELIAHKKREAGPPAVLFEKFDGYPPGFRIFSGMANSPKRYAYIMGFDEPDHPLDLVRGYRDRAANHAMIPPKTVATGPVLENIQREGEVNINLFPTPRLHEHDGGRYIGTHDLVIMRDPDTGWVNVATYRVMVQDANTVSIWMSPGKHGRLIRDKYFERGEVCPVAICVGADPLLFYSANNPIDYGVDEYAHAGGHLGRPFEVVETELYKLPIPAEAELVLEGAFVPDEMRPEGPFGEFTGYYANPVRDEPIVRIGRVYHRNDPIMTTATPMRPPSDYAYSRSVTKAALIWEAMEKAGVPGIEGVWCFEAGASHMFNAVSIKQLYPGHAIQAGMLAANCTAGNYLGRWTVVVDDDIDPTDLDAVIWAMSTRCDPAEDVDIVRKSWSTPLDPVLTGSTDYRSNRGVIDACRPFDKRAEFPRVVESSPELRNRVADKWRDVLDKL